MTFSGRFGEPCHQLADFLVLPAQVLGKSNETETTIDRFPIHAESGGAVTRALKSNTLWLTVGYVSLLLLMARAYT
jgi:hypothetical protein